MSGPGPGRVFISYRRQEASGMAGRLYDRLTAHLSDEQVFIDVDTIAPGVDFARVITQAVSTSQVLLAVIGPQWLTITDEDGQRRLDHPDDIVRLEIAAALQHEIRVIPVLVDGAVMPGHEDLPEDLADLARRNALSVRHRSFRSDADRLLAAIEPILHPPPPTLPAAPKVLPYPSTVQVLHHNQAACAVAFSSDGRLLATGGWDGTARIWEVASGQERTRLTHADEDGVEAGVEYDEDGYEYETMIFVQGVAFSPDGRLLATTQGRSARIWEVASGQERARLTHDHEVDGVAFSPDGRLLATACEYTARIWEVASGQERARIETHKVDQVAFSPDGRLLATAEDGSARVWEVAGGHERTQLIHPAAQRPFWRRRQIGERTAHSVQGVAFSPDGLLLATASDDKTARVWEVAGGQERARVTHDGSVLSVAFSPDGRLLATASDDKSARVWALVQ
jgi:WD40 repeat protein